MSARSIPAHSQGLPGNRVPADCFGAICEDPEQTKLQSPPGFKRPSHSRKMAVRFSMLRHFS